MFRFSGSLRITRLFFDQRSLRHDFRGLHHDRDRAAAVYVRRVREGRQTARKDPDVYLQTEDQVPGRKTL